MQDKPSHLVLLSQIDKTHNEDELRTLCFALIVDYDNLPGDTKKGKIRELILHLKRENRLEELTTRLQIIMPRIRSTKLPPPNYPFLRNLHFTDRPDLFSQLNNQLQNNQVLAIAGIGGVGKTQLALEYSYRQAAKYNLIHWLRANDLATLNSDITTLAQQLGIADQQTDSPTALATLLNWLATTNYTWLLIFDNVDSINPRDLKTYLPRSGLGKVLITSRNPNWGSGVRVLSTNVYEPDESVRFLKDRTGKDDPIATAKLAATLGHLPLALEHAAAYINKTGGTYAAYQDLFTSHRQELLNRVTQPEAYHATILTTWELAFQQVLNEAPAATDLLCLCSFLAPDDIHLQMLVAAAKAKELPASLNTLLTNPFAIDDAIAALMRYSLLQREGYMLSVHRLVQMVTRDRMETEQVLMWLQTVVTLTMHLFPDQSQLHTWHDAPNRLPHALTVANLAADYDLQTSDVAYLNNRTGFYINFKGDNAGARPYYEHALTIREAQLGTNHPETAKSLNNLGSLLQEMGEHDAARTYYERALAIRESLFGLDHLDTAQSLNNLGFLLQDIGEYEAAQDYYEHALAIRESLLGPDHPNTAQSLNNLGSLMQDVGNYSEARTYYERALVIRETQLGANHPYTAISLNNLASLLHATGNNAAARPYYERALAIRETQLGPDHPDTATSLNNLGYLLKDMGDLLAARPYYERALAICETQLGPDHPNTAISLDNLGSLLLAMGDHTAAHLYYKRALAIFEAQLGPDHPDTATCLNNLGDLLKAMGNYAARPYYERALAIKELQLGSNHPSTQKTQRNLEQLLQLLN